jgi:TusA-related sulfurtransferase
MENELLIKFGGENHIRVETLTEFLDCYKDLLYKINETMGHSKDDLIIEVFPPENGSFKIKLNPRYRDLMLNNLSSIIASTLSGLLLVWILSKDTKLSLEDVAKIIEIIESNEKKEIAKNVYNIYQFNEVKQTINQTFEIISNDPNIKSLDVALDSKELFNIDRQDFEKHIDNNIEQVEKTLQNPITISNEVSLVVKTVHFEGDGKWAFVWKGYPIKATMKDAKFLKRLNNESFKRGDILEVILQQKQTFDDDLKTMIVDQSSYVILEVKNHISKNTNENYTLGLND